MSTPDQPETPQLTRRQLRELRNTASTPIITPDFDPDAEQTPPVAPLPRAAEPAEVAEAPVADESVDLDAPALTRRQARIQERLRTASVPVISDGTDAAAAPADTGSDEGEWEAESESLAEGEPTDGGETEAVVEAELEDVETGATDTAAADIASDDDVVDLDQVVESEQTDSDGSEPSSPTADDAAAETADAGTASADTDADADDDEGAATDAATGAATDIDADDDGDDTDIPDDARRGSDRVLGAAFGASLLAGEPVEVELPPSFDQLLSRGSSANGSLSVPNALILSQTPDAGSLVSPVTSTGEVLITGAFTLPDNYGATGRAPGTADGKEIDATLVDGELPASSSPTPIAASAAISTIKSAEDIIRPPAPEKGSRLMMTLAITAGVLALALAGVLIVALVTGVFS